MTSRNWDEMYRSRGHLVSDEPNDTVRFETAGLRPGRALDVGCGLGADARWLADNGWIVTALDVSALALARARELARSNTRVEWRQGDLMTADLHPQPYDLVSVHFVPLRRDDTDTVVRRLLATVAPGGTLLVVNHDVADLAPEDRLAAADHYLTSDLIGLLGSDWTVGTHERRPRTRPAPAGTSHGADVILLARRAPRPECGKS